MSACWSSYCRRGGEEGNGSNLLCRIFHHKRHKRTSRAWLAVIMSWEEERGPGWACFVSNFTTGHAIGGVAIILARGRGTLFRI